MSGDFKIVINKDLDTINYKKLNNPKAKHELQNIMNLLGLQDFFRSLYPELKRYSWRKKSNKAS